MGLFTQDQRPAKRYVTGLGVGFLATFLVAAAAVVITNVVGAWPSAVPVSVDVSVADTLGAVTPEELDSIGARAARSAMDRFRAASQSADTIRVYAVLHTFRIAEASWDFRLLLISIWFGALGSLLHAGSSFVSFAGNRQLVSSWGPWYVVRPLLGAGLAAIFYVVVRAGLATTGGMPFENVSHYTVAAAAALVGLFTQRATLKLRDVFDALFPPGQAGDHTDKLGEDGEQHAPTITALNPTLVQAGGDSVPVEVTADGTGEDTQLLVNGKETAFERLPNGNLRFVLEKNLRARKGSVEVVLKNQGGPSAPMRIVVTP